MQRYWDARPCNLRHSTAEVGSRQYFDEVEVRKYFVEPHIPAFAEFAKWKGKKVLEIGCGLGTDSINSPAPAPTRRSSSCHRRASTLCKRRFEVMGLNGTFHQGDAERLPKIVPPQPFDLVYSFGVIHHTPRPEQVIAHIRAHYMGPASELRLMLYSKWCWKTLWIVASYGKGAFWRAPAVDRDALGSADRLPGDVHLQLQRAAPRAAEGLRRHLAPRRTMCSRTSSRST